jgi:hypothetical protein
MKQASDTRGIKEIIKEELPKIMQTDEEVTRFILRISSQYYAGKIETEDRFDRILNEMERDREAQSRKWDEQSRKWDEQNRKWEEQNRKWDEQNSKWRENQKIIEQMLDDIKVLNKRHFDSIAALGARWGLRSEASFRNGLASILEETFKVQVIHFAEFDNV